MRVWVLKIPDNRLIIRDFSFFIGRTKSVLPDEKKKKEYFRRFSNLIFMLY